MSPTSSFSSSARTVFSTNKISSIIVLLCSKSSTFFLFGSLLLLVLLLLLPIEVVDGQSKSGISVRNFSGREINFYWIHPTPQRDLSDQYVLQTPTPVKNGTSFSIASFNTHEFVITFGNEIVQNGVDYPLSHVEANRKFVHRGYDQTITVGLTEDKEHLYVAKDTDALLDAMTEMKNDLLYCGKDKICMKHSVSHLMNKWTQEVQDLTEVTKKMSDRLHSYYCNDYNMLTYNDPLKVFTLPGKDSDSDSDSDSNIITPTATTTTTDVTTSDNNNKKKKNKKKKMKINLIHSNEAKKKSKVYQVDNFISNEICQDMIHKGIEMYHSNNDGNGDNQKMEIYPTSKMDQLGNLKEQISILLGLGAKESLIAEDHSYPFYMNYVLANSDGNGIANLLPCGNQQESFCDYSSFASVPNLKNKNAVVQKPKGKKQTMGIAHLICSNNISPMNMTTDVEADKAKEIQIVPKLGDLIIFTAEISSDSKKQHQQQMEYWKNYEWTMKCTHKDDENPIYVMSQPLIGGENAIMKIKELSSHSNSLSLQNQINNMNEKGIDQVDDDNNDNNDDDNDNVDNNVMESIMEIADNTCLDDDCTGEKKEIKSKTMSEKLLGMIGLSGGDNKNIEL